VLEKILESPLDCKQIQPVHPKGNQSWIFFGRTDAAAETPRLWPPDMRSWLIGKDSDAGRDWGQEEEGMTEDEMAGWHHWLNGHESEWTLGVGDGQGGLACCNSWGRKESDMTEWLNWTELMAILFFTTWDFTFTTRHIHNWASFLFWPSHFFLSGAISNCPPLFPSLAYWMPSDLGGSSCSVISFCLFLLFMVFSREEYWNWLPFHPLVDHVLSALFIVTHPSWVTLHTMADGFTEVWKPPSSLQGCDPCQYQTVLITIALK